MTEALAGVNIADVHFDGGNLHRHQSVMQRDRGVRVAPGIDDDPDRLFGMRLVDEIDQFAFAVGLPAIGLQAKLFGGLGAKFFDVGKLQIEVRAVEHVNRLGSCLGHPNPGNVAVGGAVIGNNRTKGKPLGRPGRASKASPGSQKAPWNLRKSLVNQCQGSAAAAPAAGLVPCEPPMHKGAGISARPLTGC